MKVHRFIVAAKERLVALNLREQFRPSALSIIYNANFFIKKGIYLGLKRHSSQLAGRLLDVGCGTKPYRDLFDVEEYIGIDIKNEAHEKIADAVDIVYDGREFPFSDASFDSVFSSEVFEHVFYLDELIKESHRVLKEGGKLLITLPFVWIEHEKPNDFARYTTFGITSLLRRNGFTVLHSEKTSTYIEAIFQMIAVYVYQTIIPKSPFLHWPLSALLIFPINIMGVALSFLSPRNPDFYLNNILLAQKDSSVVSG